MSEPRKPYVIWGMVCPFAKDGAPVVGNFGRTQRRVVIIEADTFTRLIAEHPTLADAQFELGTLE